MRRILALGPLLAALIAGCMGGPREIPASGTPATTGPTPVSGGQAPGKVGASQAGAVFANSEQSLQQKMGSGFKTK